MPATSCFVAPRYAPQQGRRRLRSCLNHRLRRTHRVKKYTQWYRSIDEESLRVLQHPELAEQVQGRARRYIAMKLVKLTLLFSAIGVALHLLLPARFELLKALIFSNGLGFALA